MSALEWKRVLTATIFGLALAAFGLIWFSNEATAERRASRAASGQMWRVVDQGGRCAIHRRAKISTAGTHRRAFGLVTIADNQCGNGQVVLSKRRHSKGSKWHILGSGSDWGYPGRCPGDLRKIPLKVLRDFFGRGTCSGFREQQASGTASVSLSPRSKAYFRSCGKDSFYGPKGGGYALILFKLRVHGITCHRGAHIGGAWFAGDPVARGWHCATQSSLTSCRNQSGTKKLRFIFDGSAG